MIDNFKEYILCAAINFVDEVKPSSIPEQNGMIICGFRHPEVIVLWNAIHPDKKFTTVKSVQGFITSKGRFVDRQLAADIAWTAGQTYTSKITLYSEDIY